MAGIRYFKPHALAATQTVGVRWWWPAIDGAYYAALITGDARYTGMHSYTCRDGEVVEYKVSEYELLFFRLNPDDWHTADDVYELGNKPRRPVADARRDGRFVTSWRLSELNEMGIGMMDTLWRNQLVWRQTPADEKALRQLVARDRERDHELGGRRYGGPRKRWYYRTAMASKKDSWRRKVHRDPERGIQEPRGFKLPVPYPHWTPAALEILRNARKY